MPVVVVGSFALSRYLNLEVTRRQMKDFDLIGTYDDIVTMFRDKDVGAFYPIQDGKKIIVRHNDYQVPFECEVAWPDSVAAEFIELVRNDALGLPRQTTICRTQALVPSIHLLYMLKMSHRFLRNSPHFEKTRNDILLMRQNGARMLDSAMDWYKRREDETYWYQHPNLNRSKEEFFVDRYQYDHDSIHRAVALYGEPAYERFKSDNAQVLISNKKFLAAPDHFKMAAVYEETAVLAIERSLVPFPGKKTPSEAFKFALQKVCTSITSGPFREYAWENYDNVLLMEEKLPPFFDKFKAGVFNGIVKLA